MNAVYINPFTDFGFKRLFGTEENKDILIDFINTLLFEDKPKIKNLTFNNSEFLGHNGLDRNVVVDLTCTNEVGEHFIIEMQKAKQPYFIDRSLLYSSRAFSNQAIIGKDWDFELKAVYFIGLLDFKLDSVIKGRKEDSNEKLTFPNVIISGEIIDKHTGSPLTDKLSLTYVQLPLFDKELRDCITHFERWLYLFRNIAKMDSVPKEFTENRVFSKMVNSAQMLGLSKEEQNQYIKDWDSISDFKNVMNFAKDEARAEGLHEGLEKGLAEGLEKGLEKGLAEGLEKGLEKGLAEGLEKGLEKGLEEGAKKGKIEIAKVMLLEGFEKKKIANLTGLSLEDIESL